MHSSYMWISCTELVVGNQEGLTALIIILYESMCMLCAVRFDGLLIDCDEIYQGNKTDSFNLISGA